MADVVKKAPLAEDAQIHRIRITLSSLNVKNLEKGKHRMHIICTC